MSLFFFIIVTKRAGKWRLSREEAAKRPAGYVQHTGATGQKRVRSPTAELRPYAYANYWCCKFDKKKQEKKKKNCIENKSSKLQKRKITIAINHYCFTYFFCAFDYFMFWFFSYILYLTFLLLSSPLPLSLGKKTPAALRAAIIPMHRERIREFAEKQVGRGKSFIHPARTFILPLKSLFRRSIASLNVKCVFHLALLF